MTYVRTRNRFDPLSNKPFKISRSKLELFMSCRRCFYLDRRLGIGQPPGFPFNLNNAVDTLLKKEFDHYRERGIPHPLMEKFKIHAVPFRHELLDHWRDALRGGIEFLHPGTNLVVSGGVDDLWVNEKSELVIVDYKATSKTDRITIEADWQKSYKRQMDVYAWLFRKNGFLVSDTSYFVYCNALTEKNAFDAQLTFAIHVLPYVVDDTWIEGSLVELRQCLSENEPPVFTDGCDYCGYQQAVRSFDQQLGFEI